MSWWNIFGIGAKEEEIITISKSTLIHLLLDTFGKCSIYVADKSFTCPKVSSVEKAMNRSGIRDKKYIKEVHDCDNYVLEMAAYMSGKGWCFGELWGYSHRLKASHAACIYVDNNFKVHTPDPQNYMDTPMSSITLIKIC